MVTNTSGEEILQEFGVDLYSMGESENRFNDIKNDPLNPFQRKLVLQRKDAFNIQCAMLDVVHGKLEPGGTELATLIVLKFWFDKRRLGRRIASADIRLEFSGLDPEGERPEVYAITPHDRAALVPTTRHEERTNEGTANIALRVQAGESSATYTWRKVVTEDITDVTTVTGSIDLEGYSYGEANCASWTLLENETLHTGVPSTLEVAVLLKRESMEDFHCTVDVKARADKKTTLEWLFGSKSHDDPLIFHPHLKPTNKLRKYDATNLGAILRDSMWDAGLASESIVAVSVESRDCKGVSLAVVILKVDMNQSDRADNGSLVVDRRYARRYPDIDVIAIHGLHSNGDGPWASNGNKPWPLSHIFDKLSFQFFWSRYMTYRYNDSTTCPYAVTESDRIYYHASKLLEMLIALRCEAFDNSMFIMRPIIFICEDIGGSIAKQAILYALSNPKKYGSIYRSIRGMIFLGCVHESESREAIEDAISRLICASPNLQTSIVRRAQSLTASILKINNDFINTTIPINVSMINVYSTTPSLQLRMFLECTVTMGIHCELRIGRDQPHLLLAKDPGSKEAWEPVRNRLNKALNSFDIGHGDTFSNILAYSSPPRSINSDACHDYSFTWIERNETFQDWISKTDACVCFIYGQKGLQAATQEVSRLLQDTQNIENVIQFDFDARDHRRNDLREMFCTILAQLGSQYRLSLVENTITKHLTKFNWNERLLFQCWMDMMNDNGNQVKNAYVIHALDQCVSPVDWFLSKLVKATEHTEKCPKIIITGSSPALGHGLQGVSAINLDEHKDVTTHHPSSPIRTRDQSLPPTIYLDGRGLEQEQLDEMEKLLGQDDLDSVRSGILHRWLLHRINCPEGPDFFSSKLCALRGKLPLTIDRVLDAVLSCVPLELQALSSRILALLSGSLQPLTVTDLGSLLELDLDHGSTIHLALGHLSPLLKESGSSVQFASTDIRKMIEATDESKSGWYYLGGSAKIHEQITHCFLEYLSQHQVQGELKSLWDNRNPTYTCIEGRHGLLSYVVSHWATHYHLSSDDSELQSKVLKFISLDDGEALKRWARVHHLLSNPTTRPQTPLESPLHIVCALSLRGLIQHVFELHPDDFPMAVAETARSGHREIFYDLVSLADSHKLSIPADQILAAILHCENIDCLRAIVTYLKNIIGYCSPWPPSLVELLCAFGMADIISDILDSVSPSIQTIAGVMVELMSNKQSMDHSIKADEVDIKGVKSVLPLPPLLHVATRYGHNSIVTILLEKGVPIDAVDELGWTALHIASAAGNLSLVEGLIKSNATIRSTNTSMNTPLELACVGGKYRIIEALGKADGKSDFYKTEPMLTCVKGGLVQCARALIDVGVCGDLKSDLGDGSHIIVLAADQDHLGLFHLIMQHLLEKDSKDNKLRASESYGSYISKALLRATERASLAMIEHLAELGANLEVRDKDGRTPLFRASWYGQVGVVQKLVELGSDVNAEADNKLTPLQAAYDSAPISEILLNNCKKKPDLNRVTPSGSALYLAASHKSPDVVKLLLQRNVDLELKSLPLQGATALTVAVYEDSPEIVEMLLEAGADVNTRNNNDSTPLQYAVWARGGVVTYECLRKILEYNPSLNLCDKQGDTAMNCLGTSTPVLPIRLLLNRGADPEIPNSDGYTPISTAIRKDNMNICKYLVSKRVNINSRHGKEGGPIHLACKKVSIEYIKLLAENGADMNILAANDLVGTPLQSACARQGSDEEQKQLIEYLLHNEHSKAQINGEGGRYGTAINAASLMSSVTVVRTLLSNGADINLTDAIERNPAQMASLRTVEMIDLYVDKPSLFSQQDVLGRSALHYAVGSGRLPVVKKVLALSPTGSGADIRDGDGWTPLMWAIRINNRTLSPDGIGDDQEAIIRFFVEDQHANTRLRVDGWGQSWSPMKLARYHGVSAEIINILTQARQISRTQDITRDAGNGGTGPEDSATASDDEWDEDSRAPKGEWVERICDACLFCYRWKGSIHPMHRFRDFGKEIQAKDSGDEEDESEEDSE
ncbi:ankyrin repeat-containing domain protein [Xylaria cf. heliscus]|nr:ankyrin repeat-containing domain protein [Xylaria cf. heliscus]